MKCQFVRNARPEQLKCSIFTLITDAPFSRTGDGDLKSCPAIIVIRVHENVIAFSFNTLPEKNFEQQKMKIEDNEQKEYDDTGATWGDRKERSEQKRLALDDRPIKGNIYIYIYIYIYSECVCNSGTPHS